MDLRQDSSDLGPKCPVLGPKCPVSPQVQTGLLQPVLLDLLNSCPVSMAKFIWFIDDKLVKFQHCNHKKRLKWSLSHTCGDSLTFTFFCKTWCTTSTHHLRDGWVFRLRHAWSYFPMLLSADMMNIFH